MHATRASRWKAYLLGSMGLFLCLAMTGCATGNAEDDAFFNRGWLWPKTLDRPYDPYAPKSEGPYDSAVGNSGDAAGSPARTDTLD